MDIVKDIGELLAHLNIDKCAVMGWSGGGTSFHTDFSDCISD